MKRMYPDDGGLKEQVRPFNDTFSAFDVIRDHFLGKDRKRNDNSALTSK